MRLIAVMAQLGTDRVRSGRGKVLYCRALVMQYIVKRGNGTVGYSFVMSCSGRVRSCIVLLSVW